MPPEIVHDLKCWIAPFCAVWGGLKHFEYRLNDRDFRVNDVLRLREYDECKQEYTGREIRARITYILKNSFEVPQGYCILSLDPQMERIRGQEKPRCIKDCIRCNQNPEGHCADDDEQAEEQRRDAPTS